MVIVKKELAPGIVVYSDILPDPDLFIQEIEDSVEDQIVSWSSAGVNSGINKKLRDTDNIPVPYLDKINLLEETQHNFFIKNISTIFNLNFNKFEKDYMDSFGVWFKSHEQYDILKYGTDQKFTNHIDDHPDYPRRISCVYYFNDNYEGGEIYFSKFNLRYKPNKNELLFFPSTYVYNHEVLPVTKGFRYAVVWWLF